MLEVLHYLKNTGEKTDTEIAEATGLTVEAVRIQLVELAAMKEIMVCQSIRFENGKKIECMSGRISGFIPKAAPGRKSTKVNLKL
jgi:hypothetical protein